MSDKNTKKPVEVSVYEGPSAEEMDKDMDIWNNARKISAKKVAHHNEITYSVDSVEELRQMEYDD